jgi:hypothetical protein
LSECSQALGALANLFQYCFKSSQLLRARIGKDFPDFGSVFAKNRRDQVFAFWGERYDPDTPILWTLSARLTRPLSNMRSMAISRIGFDCKEDQKRSIMQKELPNSEESIRAVARTPGRVTLPVVLAGSTRSTP